MTEAIRWAITCLAAGDRRCKAEAELAALEAENKEQAARIAALEEGLRYVRAHGTLLAIPGGACRPCKEHTDSILSTAPSGMVAVEREKFRIFEWAAGGRCPICRRHRWDGHTPDCWLAVKLKEGDDEAN